MRDVVRGYSPRGVLVPVVLNGCRSAGTILDIEVTAAGILRSAPGVSHQGAEAVRESPLEFCLESFIVPAANSQSVIDTRAYPGHQAKRIDLGREVCAASRVRRGTGIYQSLAG